jgi:hypothetical protein
MCGVIRLGDQTIEIDCRVELEPWRHPWPPIDWIQVQLEADRPTGPSPVPWQVNLTRIGQVLATAGRLENAELADRLGELPLKLEIGLPRQPK